MTESSPKMFEWLPGSVHIAIAWIGYVWMVWAYIVAQGYYNNNVLHDNSGVCWMFEPLCKLMRIGLHDGPLGEGSAVNKPHEVQVKQYDSSERAYIYFNNLFWYGLFFLQHTGMKKKVFKQTIFPVSERLERGLYVLAAGITYHMCFRMQMPLPHVLYNIENKWALFVLGLTNLFGTLFCLWSTFVLDHWSFCGITQAYA